MSLRAIFNKLFFRKHTPGKVVATSGDKAFQKLETVHADSPMPPFVGIDPSNFNLELIGLRPGTYTLTATVSAPSWELNESDQSNPVEYTVK